MLTVAAIEVGKHITTHIFGFTIDADTVWSTALAGLILIVLGLIMRATMRDGVPSKLQLIFETIVEMVRSQVESTIGPEGKPIVPLAVTLFLFILIANLIELIPSGHNPEYLPAPTADVNLTFALAAFVIVLVHAASIKKRGIRGYIRHYFRPYFFLFPINVIEEIAKPITLALRLFGNMFSGGLMLALIATLFPLFIVPVPEIVWKLFDVFVAVIQAFIFALLTILYFSSAMSEEE